MYVCALPVRPLRGRRDREARGARGSPNRAGGRGGGAARELPSGCPTLPGQRRASARTLGNDTRRQPVTALTRTPRGRRS